MPTVWPVLNVIDWLLARCYHLVSYEKQTFFVLCAFVCTFGWVVEKIKQK